MGEAAVRSIRAHLTKLQITFIAAGTTVVIPPHSINTSASVVAYCGWYPSASFRSLSEWFEVPACVHEQPESGR